MRLGSGDTETEHFCLEVIIMLEKPTQPDSEARVPHQGQGKKF